MDFQEHPIKDKMNYPEITFNDFFDIFQIRTKFIWKHQL